MERRNDPGPVEMNERAACFPAPPTFETRHMHGTTGKGPPGQETEGCPRSSGAMGGEDRVSASTTWAQSAGTWAHRGSLGTTTGCPMQGEHGQVTPGGGGGGTLVEL